MPVTYLCYNITAFPNLPFYSTIEKPFLLFLSSVGTLRRSEYFSKFKTVEISLCGDQLLLTQIKLKNLPSQ